MMKVIATSDLHGALPEIEPCDLLLIGGDVCPVTDHRPKFQRGWLRSNFTHWLERVPAKHVIGIGGNHDYIFEEDPTVPRSLPWTYLCDEYVDVDGVRVFGTPWVPNLPRWAFYGGEDGCTIFKIGRFPEGIDVLLSHGPMRGFGDTVGPYYGGPVDVGCIYMRERVREIKPRVFVCGHIHEAYGHYRHPFIEKGVYNVAHMTDRYEPTQPPVEITL